MNLCGEEYSRFEVIRERKLFFMEEKDKNCNGILFFSRRERGNTKYVEIRKVEQLVTSGRNSRRR